ncbi:hypothetical protein K491DRAFT_591039 [Lophiostoma macrostomum CBS 122681]|uniref:Uncharacterized protein n=1 Tax=Lophiostoma macrostomum CBS 122681 TaxID=1314788 RepID=A0A6A6THH0_9PLEO|nr:hypothetical protein K491DRAFT_591039 [Lophiostoma macrostomum CBS 122681]
MSKLITYPLAFGVTAVSSYFLFTWNQISTIPRSQISVSRSTPETFRTSRSNASIINPNAYPANNSSRSITLRVERDLSDEVLLARFVKGFFGGYVFAPESIVLRAMNKDMVKYSALQNTPVKTDIWHHSLLSSITPPQSDSLLFGAFRVIDYHIECSGPSDVVHDKSTSTDNHHESHSYIDFAFGREDGRLAGMHRFSIIRHAADEEGKVTIEFSDTALNPRAQRPLESKLFMSFHMVYAMCLFRDGVRSVKDA